MYIVYILRSSKNQNRHYVGMTENLQERLKEHNSGLSTYSKSFAPWELETYIAFTNKLLAIKFERYLKAGSGHVFLKKHFLP